MAFHANTMSSTMCEIFSVTRFLDYIPRCFVHICARDAGPRGGAACSIRFLYDFVDFLVFLVYLAHRKCARQIGDIAIVGRSPIDHKEITSLQFALSGRGMRVGGIWPP